jgi:hypothetical protein
MDLPTGPSRLGPRIEGAVKGSHRISSSIIIEKPFCSKRSGDVSTTPGYLNPLFS